MEINRLYVHRTYGDVGGVAFVVPDGEYKLDGKVLPESSVEALMRHGLQMLLDAYAGAKNIDEAQGMFNTKYDKLVNGTLGTRGDGTGASTETIIARSIMRAAMKDKFGKDSPEWKSFTGLDDKAQLAKLDDNIAANKEYIDECVKAEIALRAEKAKNRKKAGTKIEITL